MSQSIRCHYDVLGVARDADAKTVKKAHRKHALKYHPDKTGGCEEAAKEFRLGQQAYECLSDAAERKWYDEHRESILRGKKFGDGSGGDGDDGMESAYIFDVTPYHFSGCYDGYGDDEGGFFQVYREVFEEILKGEKNGWISEGNIDETEMTNAHLPTDFGCGSTEWKTVSHFYNSWESFTSSLSFAFADKYDIREAESRWEKRRINEENQKARKMAKRERNEEVIQFVAFVKKRDPRVKDAREKAIKEKLRKEKLKKEEDVRKKIEAAAARETWRLEREKELQEAEMADLDAGRIRLADLSDSDDDYYRGGRKKGKKGKKNRKRGKQKAPSDDENETINDVQEDVDSNAVAEEDDVENNSGNGENTSLIDEDILDEILYDDEEEEETSSEEEPEIFRCEICRKTFKSEKQLENHLKSKKHKEAVKKWQKKQKG
jgi:DnaJ family protein A protein 5